ncbi:hypothetical protein LGL55_17150 [Clostridium tagluense]|uniref:hypothetical protein n=1 Tax=Clostridium tagluense TaxID=360422 RepID=UPI001CF4DE3B|nr:hypothetical protein [Clostridium tagluense]MCB2312998.1 hypothetical protein [Clostridium tagluense]MCB2317764.1 hypothetical protein [Clostridium tagluense]MCB2322547.1 hypothetical protein [Clostridium tagluense]MCB2327547.1 hypothetical protein [Clostridium tagluense]MCB2332628.1 hypothetical protein [Clostridium tagluense]
MKVFIQKLDTVFHQLTGLMTEVSETFVKWAYGLQLTKCCHSSWVVDTINQTSIVLKCIFIIKKIIRIGGLQ